MLTCLKYHPAFWFIKLCVAAVLFQRLPPVQFIELQHKQTLRVPLPTASLLQYRHSLHWLYDSTGAHLQSCKLGPLGDGSSQPGGWECVHHPLGLIYCPMLGCYCTDLLLRPGVNCPALGSISNRTARDMGPDTSKRWHYIIPRCFSKWSTQTPPYKSLGEGSQNLRPELPGNVISFRAHWERSSSSIMTSTLPPLLLLEDQWMCGVSVAIFYLNNYSII